MGLILSIDEEELNFYKKQYLNAGDLRDNIEKLESEEPSDKRKKEWRDWSDKLQYLYKLYNVKVGYTVYKTTTHEVRKRVGKKKDTGEQSPL